jgi:hypothetical protein
LVIVFHGVKFAAKVVNIIEFGDSLGNGYILCVIKRRLIKCAKGKHHMPPQKKENDSPFPKGISRSYKGIE